MIFVTDKGRMCNNILQYGHLYAWGREHSVGTVSMRFCYKYPYFSIRHKRWHNPLTYALVKAAVKLKMMPVVEFHQMGSVYHDEQHIMLTNRFVYAWGWCVRFFDLFEKYKDEIRSLFAFRQSIIRHTQAPFRQPATMPSGWACTSAEATTARGRAATTSSATNSMPP